MDDCYKYVNSDWHIFGYSQYISTRRNISDNVLLSCIPAIKDAMTRAKLNHQANDYNSLEPIEGTDFLLQYDGYYFRVWSDTFKCECIDEEGIAKRLFEDKELPLK